MYPSTNAADSRTLWMGDIEHWMDENYISSLYSSVVQGGLVSVKVIRDKNTGLPTGYSFVEFANHQVASHVLNTFNGSAIPGTHKTFRLNWGVFGGGQRPAGNVQVQQPIYQPQIQMPIMQQQQQMIMPINNFITQPYQQQPMQNIQAVQNDFSIYVCDLDPTINDQQLADFFRLKYKTVISAKIIIDPQTKMSKGYGFVKFGDQAESNRALSEMNGTLFRGRHMKTNSATWKSSQMSNLQYQQTQQMNLMQDPMIQQNQQFYGAQGGQLSYTDYQYQQYASMVQQQQLLTHQQQQSQYGAMLQASNQPKLNNPPVYSKKVEKPSKQQQREEFSENSMDFILNKIDYETLQKFLE